MLSAGPRSICCGPGNKGATEGASADTIHRLTDLAGIIAIMTIRTLLGRRPLAFSLLVLLALVIGSILWSQRRGPQPPTEIFAGIVYGCEQLERTEEGSGLLYWVRVHLAAPGIELYVTPLDPDAVAQGWQYRLRAIGSVMNAEHLAVVINATAFGSHSPLWVRLPGDLARGVETVVADHVASHVWERTSLLWFDDALTPHLLGSNPPTAAELARAKWGVGALAIGLKDGQLGPGSDRRPDARTAVGIDRERKLLFMGVGENISPRLILQKLAELGARDGILLDGGGSSAMAIGPGANGVHPGVIYGGWRPVATFFGVRAHPFKD
jgi:hypothetical protein